MMRRQRNIFDMFPEKVDLNQGPSFNGLDMTESDECNSRLSPTERRLLGNDISGERNKSQSYSNWDVGESSSRPNVQSHVANSNNNRSPFSKYGERQFDHSRVVGSNNGNSSGTSNERGTDGSFGNNQGQSLSVVNPCEPKNPERSRRYFDQRPTNSSQRSTQQPPLMHVPGMPRNLLPFPFIGNANSRNGSSSSSGFNQDNRSIATGRSNISGVIGQSSSRNDTIMLPNLNSTANDQQPLPPWTLFPYLDTESGSRRGHTRDFPSGSSSSDVNSKNQPRHHQPSLRLEVPDDGWHALCADIEGRQRLVSEV